MDLSDKKMNGVDMRDAFFDEIYEIGKKDKNVIFITDDLGAYGLRRFREDFPDQFINIGVAEQNMIDVAAGLAAQGKKAFVYGICTYVTMRCFEQIKFSVCGMNLPVVIIGVGAGFSFAFDGPTHHGTQDVAIMRVLPEMKIYNPSDSGSAARMAWLAYKAKGPVYIRLDKGLYPVFYERQESLEAGFKIIKELQECNIISTGYMTQGALSAAEALEEKHGLKVGVVDLYQLKPVGERFIKEVLLKSRKIITVEEHSLIGGLGSLVGDCLDEMGRKVLLKKIAVPDKQYLLYGTRDWFHKTLGLDTENIVKETVRFIKESL